MAYCEAGPVHRESGSPITAVRAPVLEEPCQRERRTHTLRTDHGRTR